MSIGYRSVLTLLVVLAACGDEDPTTPESRQEALRLAQSFAVAVAAGNWKDATEEARAPFVFRGRTWKNEAELTKNLPPQLALLKDEIAGSEEVEVFSSADLLRGRWPRGETISEGQRVDRMEKLGVQTGGFIVRLSRESKKGVLLVMNLEGGTRLRVRGLHD